MSRSAWAVAIALLSVSCGPAVRTHQSVPGEPVTRLRMGMLPADVHRLFPDTPCRVDTEFHGNPAEAWGYSVRNRGEGYRVIGTECNQADFWIYFEDGKLVGWSPPP